MERPLLTIINEGKKTVLEEFQNAVLRPILKMRNDELVKEFAKYILKSKSNFNQVSKVEKEKLIFDLLKSKPKLFVNLSTYIVDELNSVENKFYLKHKNELNKRLKEMLGQRLGDNLSKLDRA